MSEPSSRNLKLRLAKLGNFMIMPSKDSADELHWGNFVICSQRMSKEEAKAVSEWALKTESPIFIVKEDLALLETQGFGAYRFHLLSTFKEYDFQGGSLTFFPARAKKSLGVGGVVRDFLEVFGYSKSQDFHVLAKDNSGDSFLFLASPFVDRLEWTLLTEGRPSAIIGSPRFSKELWGALGERSGTKIYSFEEITQNEGVFEVSAPKKEIEEDPWVQQVADT